MQTDEHAHDEHGQPVPHGALADLFERAEQIRQAVAELGHGEGDGASRTPWRPTHPERRS